ncbi:MAG: hypothetical protein FWD65_02170 [Coriobacteriia bacterium]|nr:hypothetical protein [Coriobacteriia bacterium]
MNTGQILIHRNVTRKTHRSKRLFALTLASGLALLCALCLCLLLSSVAYGAGPAQVTLPVKQTFTSHGSSNPASDVFSYRLVAQGAAPLPDGSATGSWSFTLQGTREVQVGPLTFNSTGIYSYELSCTDDSDVNITGDTEVYRLTVYVKSDLTTLIIIRNNAGEKVSQMSFDQSYRVLPSDSRVMVDPPVVKTVTGNPTQKGRFGFILKAEDPSYPMPAGSDGGAKTIWIMGAGQKDFGVWSYSSDGTYHYTIAELDTSLKNYTYDTEVYTITDVVTDRAGRLVVDRRVTDRSGKQVSLPYSLSFVNRYEGARKTILGGTKDSSHLPKTGDLVHPAFWLAALLLISSVFIALWRYRTSAKAQQATQ